MARNDNRNNKNNNNYKISNGMQKPAEAVIQIILRQQSSTSMVQNVTTFSQRTVKHKSHHSIHARNLYTNCITNMQMHVLNYIKIHTTTFLSILNMHAPCMHISCMRVG